ncbi:hypothetical protein KJ966_22205 [bacterium]|nr:hypothetical protein [bacterium]
MNSLIVVNSHFCPKTEKFWIKNQSEIENQFRHHTTIHPKSKNYKNQIDIDEFDVIILIGDDTFFSCFVNSIFYDLSDKKKIKHIAFIPDRHNTAIASGLGLPSQLSKQLELISRKPSILLDLVRCHYMDKRGIPRSHFVLNDVLIGISPSKIPLVIKTLAELVKSSPLLSTFNNSKEIQVINEGAIVYSGNYIFSAVLLGNKITNGPKIPTKAKIRTNLTCFEYYQLNSRRFSSFKAPFKRLFQDSAGNEMGYIFSGSYNELIIKGEGFENTIIADGVHLGRMPTTFSFLPKALRVIAPLLTVRVSQPWKSKVSASTVPRPIGSRSSLSRDT